MCSISFRLPRAVRGRVRLLGRILPRRTSLPAEWQSVSDRTSSAIGERYQVESLLCSIANSASSDNRDLVRSRLRLVTASEQILAKITLRHGYLRMTQIYKIVIHEEENNLRSNFFPMRPGYFATPQYTCLGIADYAQRSEIQGFGI